MTFEELRQGFQRVQDLRTEADTLEKAMKDAFEAKDEEPVRSRQKGKAPVRDSVQAYFDASESPASRAAGRDHATIGMVIEGTGQKAESVRTAMNQLLDWGWLESFDSAGQTLYRKAVTQEPGEDDAQS